MVLARPAADRRRELRRARAAERELSRMLVRGRPRRRRRGDDPADHRAPAVEPGPPDPSSFADELFVKLYDENTGYDWIQSFYVASPRGLDEMLQRESWDYAYTDRVFFVRRYDAKTIRMAVIEQLLSTQEKPSPPKGNEDAYV